MRTRNAWMIALVLAVGLSGVAFGQPAEPKPGCGGSGCAGGGKGKSALALTEEQHKKIDDLKMAHLKEVMPVRTDLEIKEMELAALWRADEPDAKKIVAKVKEVSGLRAKLELSRVNQRLAMYNVLSPEQRMHGRRFFGRRMMGKRGRRGMRRGMGHGMGPGMMGGPGMHGAGMGEHGQGSVQGMGMGPGQGGCGQCQEHKKMPPGSE